MAHRFHSNSLLGLGEIVLNQDESTHVLVSRIRPGEQIVLFNGDGNNYIGVYKGMNRREACFNIEDIKINKLENPFRIIIGAPLPKGDREQFMIEKLVELGVSLFVPLKTDRSVIHPETKRVDRLRRHVIEASKQCGRSHLMQIESITPWQSFLSTRNENQQGWIAHGPSKDSFEDQTIIISNNAILGAIGPEGGLSDQEVEQAKSIGWKTVNLGERILRIETAAMLLAWELGKTEKIFNQVKVSY